MADQIDIDNLVRQLEQLVPALNSLSGTRAQNNQTGGDELKKGFDKVVRSIAKLNSSLDRKAKTEDARVRSTEEFIKSVDDASDALDELTKAQKEAERQAQAQLDAVQAEIAAREEAAKIARMSTAELAEKARADKLAAAQSYANAQKQAQLNKKGTDSASAMLEELGRIPHGTAALRERFEGLGGSSMGATVGLKLTTAALEGLVAGLGAYGSALYKGEIGAKTAAKGMTTFVKAVAGAAKAIGAILLLVPGFQVLGAGLLAAGFAAEKFAEYTEAAAEMSDNLYNSFQDLQKTGVIGAGAMTEVAESARRLNLGLDAVGLQKFGKLMEQNSESLAALGGSAIRGRKAFVEIGEQLTHGSTGRALMNMGMSIEQINEGTATYLALQAQTGQGQRKTTQQLQQGAMAYLKEMDGLAKLTGIQRKELENNIMKARSVEQFRAKVNAMRASGDAKQIAAADEMEKTYAVLAKQAPDVAQGFAEAASGLITSDAGRRYFMGIERNTSAVRDLTSGNIKAEEALGNMYRAADKSTREFNTLAQAGAAGDVIGNFGQMSDLAARSGQDMKKTSDEIRATQEQQMAGADGATAAQTDMRMAQMQTRDSLQNMVNVGVKPATSAMSGFSDVVNRGTTFLAKALGIEKTMDPGERQKREDVAAKQEAENLKHTSFFGKITQYGAKAVEGLAYGAGKAADAVGAEGMGGALMDWSTESKERRVQASREALQKAGKGVQDVSGGAMGGGGAAGAGGRAPGGPQGAATPAFGGAVGGGGVGPVRGQAGGPPSGTMGVDSLFNFGSGTGSQAHFNKLDPGFQQALINMAQEYQQTTGQKLNLNSAYRSPEEQARVNSGGRPRAAPGRSRHQQGMAADLNSNEVAFLKQSGLLGKYGFKTLSDDPPHIYMRDGGIIPARQGGTRVVAGEAGKNEAFVPLPDGKNIPVEINAPYQPPSAEQIRKAYSMGDALSNMQIVPGMNIQNESSWATASGSVAQKLDFALTEMMRNNRALQNEMAVVRERSGGRMNVADYLGFLMRTPEGKVWAAQNDFGRTPYSDKSPENQRLRAQYEEIRQRINMQDRAAMAAGKFIGGSIEDPISRMEVLAADYLERQTRRQAAGTGNWQMGDTRDARLSVINEQVIAQLRRIDEQFRAMPKMAEGGITRGPSIVGEAGPEAVLPIGKILPVTLKPDPFPALQNTFSSGFSSFADQQKIVEGMLRPVQSDTQSLFDKVGEAFSKASELVSGDMKRMTGAMSNATYTVNGKQVSEQEYNQARADIDRQFGNITTMFRGVGDRATKDLAPNAAGPRGMFDSIKNLWSGLTQQTDQQGQSVTGPLTGMFDRVKNLWSDLTQKFSSGGTQMERMQGRMDAARQKHYARLADKEQSGQKSQQVGSDMVSRTRARIEEARQRMATRMAEAEKQGNVEYEVNGRKVDKQQYDAFLKKNPQLARMQQNQQQQETSAAQQNLTAAQKIDKLKQRARSTEQGARIGAVNDANMGLTTEQKLAKLKAKARGTEEGARIGAMNDANMGLSTEQKLAKLREKSGQAQFSGLTRPSKDFQEVDITSQFDRINEQIKTQLPSAGVMGDDWMSDTDAKTSDWLAMGQEKMAQGRAAFDSATAMDPAMKPGQGLDVTIKKLEESLNRTAAEVKAPGAAGAPGALGTNTAASSEPIKMDGMSELIGKLSDMVSQQRTTTMAIEKMAQYQRA